MKTAVVMERELYGHAIRQNSKSKMFNGNDLLKVCNEGRKIKGLEPKQMGNYMVLNSTKELIDTLCIQENIEEQDALSTKRGKYGGTWMHPVVMIDFAMWLSPELKVKILNWVIDGLIGAREESGESFKSAMSALAQGFPKEADKPNFYHAVARQIAEACRVGNDKDKWQRASESQLRLRDSIHEYITVLADVTPNAGSCVSKAISKAVSKEMKKLTAK
jgi:hypothetical protein